MGPRDTAKSKSDFSAWNAQCFQVLGAASFSHAFLSFVPSTFAMLSLTYINVLLKSALCSCAAKKIFLLHKFRLTQCTYISFVLSLNHFSGGPASVLHHQSLQAVMPQEPQDLMKGTIFFLMNSITLLLDILSRTGVTLRIQ